MNNKRLSHLLFGCSPVPLASYLKALGVLRIVSEQADASVRGSWRGDVFCLDSVLSEEELLTFLRERYAPTPLVGPWGARSGFFSGGSEKSAREALAEIETSELPRLTPFAAAIASVRRVLASIGLTDKAETPEQKRELMMACRAMLPDELLQWLDATYVLLDEDTKYPPLLGTGGNEGSGSYMSGFAQQVVAVLIDRQWDHALRPALFGTPEINLGSSQTPGHFSPEAAGGPNAASTSDGRVATNPWDYLLMLEGTLLFAAACVKRLEQRDPGMLSYPFCVRQAGVGYGSASDYDEANSRAEIWLPVWQKPSTVAELSALFSEGRAQIGSRPARNGVDFARAIAALGTDRGIGEFQRYAFQQRNGLSFFAIPLGRFVVTPQPQVSLLAEIDRWFDSFRRAASSDNAPSSAGRALRRLESAVLELCRERGPNRVQAVLIALGEAEAMLARSLKWRAENYQRPVPLLSPEWFTNCDDSSPEFRLAASLAGIYTPVVGDFRQHIEPVEIKGSWVAFAENTAAASSVVWSEGDLEENLIAVLRRRSIEAVQLGEQSDDHTLIFPGASTCHAALSDIASFIDRETDDEKIVDLVRGLTLLNWQAVRASEAAAQLNRGQSEPLPDATYGLLKLCHSPYPVRETFVRLEPSISRLLATGRVSAATSVAGRRLLGSSLPPAVRAASRAGDSARRLAAALLFPVTWADLHRLAYVVLKPEPETV